jgi:hypothetical protein
MPLRSEQASIAELSVTRGAPIWGRDVLKRFEALYQGTWRLSPDLQA